MENEELTTFDFDGEMTTHFSAAGSDTKPYNCNECEKSYMRKHDLKLHFTNEHTDGKGFFECTFCDESFKTKYSMKCQKIAKHPEKFTKPMKMHNCDHCEYETPHRVLMNQHKRSHKANREVGCNICGILISKYGMKQHLKLVHGEDKLIRHQCDICDKDFVYSHSLNKHQKEKHLLK